MRWTKHPRSKHPQTIAWEFAFSMGLDEALAHKRVVDFPKSERKTDWPFQEQALIGLKSDN